jgi:hypothetical protein
MVTQMSLFDLTAADTSASPVSADLQRSVVPISQPAPASVTEEQPNDASFTHTPQAPGPTNNNQQSRQTPALYVATNLAFQFVDNPAGVARDIDVNGVVFRRLDPEYYAFLRSKMKIAQTAHESGQLPEQAWEQLRIRFNDVHRFAKFVWNEEALLEVVKEFNPRVYSAPATNRH